MSALRDQLFPGYCNISDNQVREDIEIKLKAEVPLLDFHELLRFIGQTGGRDPEHFTKEDHNVVIGWNAWRLLCSTKRQQFTREWVRQYLVKDESMAQQLWDFFREISDQ